MALVVEDGTGKADSESYISVADIKVYWTAHGYDWATPAYSDTAIEQALRRATSAVDARVLGRVGSATPLEATQALLWPLEWAYDRYGYVLASDAVPRQIVQATAEAGWREVVTPGSMAPDVAAGASLLKRAKAGDVEVEFALSGAGASFKVIDDLLSGLFGSRSPYSGIAIRA